MPEFKNEDHREHYLGRRAKALDVLTALNTGLENLPDMKKVEVDTVQHQWNYYTLGSKFERLCTNPGCDKSETIRTRLTAEQIKSYESKITKNPELFEKKSGTCTNYTYAKGNRK